MIEDSRQLLLNSNERVRQFIQEKLSYLTSQPDGPVPGDREVDQGDDRLGSDPSTPPSLLRGNYPLPSLCLQKRRIRTLEGRP